MRAPVLSGMTLLALVALIGLSLCIGVASVSSGDVVLAGEPHPSLLPDVNPGLHNKQVPNTRKHPVASS